MKTADTARQVIEDTFFLERSRGDINQIAVDGPCTIIAAVGDDMSSCPGVAGRFFAALARSGCNVKAISQGSSERNISAVVRQTEATRALRAVHAAFFLSRHGLSVGVVGGSTPVGQAFLKDLHAPLTQAVLRRRGVDLTTSVVLDVVTAEEPGKPCEWGRLRAVVDGEGGGESKAAGGDGSGDGSGGGDEAAKAKATVVAVAQAVAEVVEPARLVAALADFANGVQESHHPHNLIVDCSSCPQVAAAHPDWLLRGISIVSRNVHATAGPQELWKSIESATAVRGASVKYLMEGTVGAGLPALAALHDIQLTGDHIRGIEGIFSGSLSSILAQMMTSDGGSSSGDGGDGGSTAPLTFSGALQRALSEGTADVADKMTPVALRELLSGMHTARKLVTVARAMGMDVEIDQVAVEAIVGPAPTAGVGAGGGGSGGAGDSIEAIVEEAKAKDVEMAARVEAARGQGAYLQVSERERAERCELR